MLTFARPVLLAAGLLAALLPLALHLIARRPPERVALPTVRFLTPDPRTAVRIRRRPTDLPLLALRILLLVLLGAAAAGPAWLPRRAGTAELVLLDGGAGMRGEAWWRAVDAARSTLLSPGGEPRGDLLLFDTAAVRIPARRVTPALLDSLGEAGPAGAPSDYAAALRALPSAARELRGADSVRVTLVSALRRGGWRPGLAHLRRAAWPGSIRLEEVASGTDAAPPDRAAGTPRRRAVVIARPGGGRYVAAALGAAGWEVPEDRAGADSVAAYVVASTPDAPSAGRMLGAVRGGATAVVA
ncbi:MAG TPA: BatA domain-containing protein, partial [Longimicrobiaceae bacterium]|nr:BatA domain-containing protein [Longimicrobiaceae bacterium]